ncbi:hypothetical protein Shyhy02_35200 [Streptomyces hygroscopicus subsp. hygroscopicus]|nr:hypothetical protein Shyhy02_35200 [Streptomyces hygroscopicus subsp. hygroscopicus]
MHPGVGHHIGRAVPEEPRADPPSPGRPSGARPWGQVPGLHRARGGGAVAPGPHARKTAPGAVAGFADVTFRWSHGPVPSVSCCPWWGIRRYHGPIVEGKAEHGLRTR